MAEFFGEDFTTDKWRKAAQKNAFVLMSKQRFVHAAAFFLLADSLQDAIQVLLLLHTLVIIIISDMCKSHKRYPISNCHCTLI
jgi:hypothetical protein